MRSIKIILVFCIILFYSLNSFGQVSAQENKKIVSSEYDRFAFTYLWNDYRSDNYKNMRKTAFGTLTVPDKYFDNQLSTNFLSIDGKAGDFNTESDTLRQIIKKIQGNHIPNLIIAKWFNRQPDGSFEMSVISERGKYNATLSDIKDALMTERGLAIISDAGEKLINKSYILVFDVHGIMTMEELAAKYKKKPSDTEDNYFGNSSNEAKQNGYKGKVSAYLFKVSFNDSIAAVFYNDFWISPGQQDINERKKAFENFDFPLQLVKKFNFEIKSAQINPGYKGAPSAQKSKEQLFNELVKRGIDNILEKIEKMDAFAVKAKITDTRPIRSKIGSKEGLYLDQRYFVYQDIGDKVTGQTVKSKRVAVIRAKKVIDNRKIAAEDIPSSEFYQVAGKKIKKYSMFIAQKNDMGLGVSLGFSQGAFDGFMARAELNLTQLSKPTGDFPKGLKLYGDAGFGSGKYYPTQISNVKDNDFTFSYLSAGFGKEKYFARNLQLTPYIGYVYLGAGWTDEVATDSTSRSIAAHALGLGATFGLNLRYNIQFKFSANLHAPLFVSDAEGNLNVPAEEVKWTDLFEGRSGFSQFLQVRFLF